MKNDTLKKFLIRLIILMFLFENLMIIYEHYFK
jgi:hypothetical protein